MKTKLQFLFIALALLAGLHQTAAQGTTEFTYQGQLRDGGANANGSYMMIFKLYDSNAGGNRIGNAITNSTILDNGLFTADLDFGADAFSGSARWLEITVEGDTLAPRSQILAVPYAQYAMTPAGPPGPQGDEGSQGPQGIQGLPGTNGVVSLNELIDEVTLKSGTNITLTTTGNSIMISADLSMASGNITAGGEIISTGMVSHGNIIADGEIQSQKTIISHLNVIADGEIQSQGTISSHLNVIADGEIQSRGTIVSHLNVIADGEIQSQKSIVSHLNIIADGEIQSQGTMVSHQNVMADGQMYAQGFNMTSDRQMKENFVNVDCKEVLERVASLPISIWNLKSDAKMRHLGPMAQDFYAAFKVGFDDKHINTVDEGGVALAAIQGLNQKVKEKDTEIQRLKSQNETLEKRLTELEAFVQSATKK